MSITSVSRPPPNEILAALREFKNYSNPKRDGLELLSKLYGKSMGPHPWGEWESGKPGLEGFVVGFEGQGDTFD